MQCLFHPFAHVVQQWPCSRLTDAQPQISGLAAYLILDSVESTDHGQSLSCCGRCMDDMNFVKLAASVSPARNFINDAIAVQMMEPCIGVCLQAALEVLQMLLWMLALAIFRVREPDGRRSIFSRGPVIAHIGPKPARFGLATARCKYRHRRIVGVKLGSSEHMLLNRIDQRSEQLTCSAYPARQSRPLNLNSLASINLRLAIERQMICKFRNQHVSQQAWPSKTTLDRTGWRRRFNHALTTAAGELRPHVADDFKAIGDVLKLLGDIFAELAQLAAAIRTAVAMKSVADNLAWEMLGQRLAPRSRLRFRSRYHPLDSGFHLCLRGLQLFQMKFELLKLNNNLLALDSEHPPPQLLDDQLQMLDLLAARAQFLVLLGECLAMGLKLSLERSKLVLMRSGKRNELLLRS